MIEIRKILVPTDFSDPSGVALKYGTAFARLFSAELLVLHVMEEPLAPAWASEGYVPSLPSLLEEIEKDARQRLDRLAAEVSDSALTVRLEALWGSPFVEIVRFAKQQQVDLIIMGTHGRGPIAHMLIGSVAERVVRKAPCPVLTVRTGEQQFSLP